jgi:hypothetical protein
MRAQYEREAANKQEILDKHTQGLRQYQDTFDKYMAQVNTIDPNLTDLSSIELIRALRGGGG